MGSKLSLKTLNWRKTHNKNLREVYFLAVRIKERLGRACGMYGEK
jgi:hypothetical protein